MHFSKSCANSNQCSIHVYKLELGHSFFSSNKGCRCVCPIYVFYTAHFWCNPVLVFWGMVVSPCTSNIVSVVIAMTYLYFSSSDKIHQMVKRELYTVSHFLSLSLYIFDVPGLKWFLRVFASTTTSSYVFLTYISHSLPIHFILQQVWNCNMDSFTLWCGYFIFGFFVVVVALYWIAFVSSKPI